jgi:hypothetical protein
VNDDIQFGTLHPDGTLTNQRSLPQSAVRACPQYILVPEHYREDGSCRCNEGYYDDETGDWIEYPQVPCPATQGVRSCCYRAGHDPEVFPHRYVEADDA